MDLLSLITFSGIMLCLAAMPSAGVALVVARSAGSGVYHGALVAAGIVVADLVFVAMALLGMTLVAEMFGGFFTVIRLLAGLYLIWFGIGFLRKSKGGGSTLQHNVQDANPWMSFLSGLLLTFGDVKAILFYASLFPALFDLRTFTSLDVLLIGLITIVNVGGTKLVYAVFARKIARNMQKQRWAGKARPVAGVCMIGAGTYVIAKP